MLLSDPWLVFDSTNMVTMVLETWVLTLLVAFSIVDAQGTGLDSIYTMRMLKLFRLMRAARVGRLLRMMPEVLIIMRSMMITLRTMIFIVIVFMIITYMFALVMIPLGKGTDIQSTYFGSVPEAMYSLTLGAVFPDMAEMATILGVDSPACAAMFLLFVVIATIMLLNMFIGLLVEVVSVVGAVEREQAQVDEVAAQLMKIVQQADHTQGNRIERKLLETLIVQPAAKWGLREVGVDAIEVVESLDIALKRHSKRTHLGFDELLELMLELRVDNDVKVKDLTQMRRRIHDDVQRLEDRLGRWESWVAHQGLPSTKRDHAGAHAEEQNRDGHHAFQNEVAPSANDFRI